MRSGASLVAMSTDQIKRIVSEDAPEWLDEHCFTGLEPQRVVELLDTQTFFDLLGTPYPTSRDGVIERLLQERLLDETNRALSIRRIGALLLAKQLSDFQDLGNKTPRVVVYQDASKLSTRIDQKEVKGYAVGFQSLVEFVTHQLPQNEVVQNAIRREVKLVPQIVIRELIANAIIHQDFSLSGTSVMIELYGDRIEISNPGEPVVPVERFIDGYSSRNVSLANLMRRMGICEEKGSGIDRVITEVERHQLPAPDFKQTYQRTVVTIFGPKEFDAMDRDDRIRACYQHCALRRVMSQPMTNQSLRERFKLPQSKTASVSQVIALTVDAGLIRLDARTGGSRKYARYLPAWA